MNPNFNINAYIKLLPVLDFASAPATDGNEEDTSGDPYQLSQPSTLLGFIQSNQNSCFLLNFKALILDFQCQHTQIEIKK